ncbi:MAG: TonB family protein [Bacteroidota bacterium]|jgi:TonB family protein
MYYKILLSMLLTFLCSFTSVSQHKDKFRIPDKGQPLPIKLTDNTAVDTTYLTQLLPVEGQESVVPIFQVIPKSPAGLPKTKKPMKVILKALVNSSGKVVKATVLKSDNLILNKPALRALMQWEFETSFDDTTIGFWVAVPFRFTGQ